jgi:hypothetical protein
MKISNIVARRRIAGISAGCLLGGTAMGLVGAPSAAAAPDRSPDGDATVSSVRGSAEQYLAAHPGANQAVTAAYGDTERQCNVSALPPNLESAYHEFVSG